MTAQIKPPRVNVLGVGISAVDLLGAVEIIEGWIRRREQHYVCVTSVHGVMECQRDEGLRRIFNRSGITTPDGRPLVWLGRRAGFPRMDRVYGPDLMLALCERSEHGAYRHFFYGAAPGVPERLAERLRKRVPELGVVGTYSPPFRPLTGEERAETVGMINRRHPDIVWVGLSTPKQERWMWEHLGEIEASVLIGVGAAFDLLSGRVRQAPRWIQRSGLEWLFRLSQEPRRLWRRYLINNPMFVVNVLLQRSGLRRWDLEVAAAEE